MGTINGKRGNDILQGTKRADWMDGREGNDQMHGGDGNDELHGNVGDDWLYGDSGNDRLLGEAGTDHLYGGDGDDTLNGGDGNDYEEGGAGNDWVNAGAGADTVIGGDGNDTVDGDAGADTATGGAGADEFFFQYQSDAVVGDVITDFTVGEDYLLGGGGWDANAAQAGFQQWEYVGSAPAAALADGNGQATVSYEGTDTVLRLYNNDGDLNADFTLAFNGSFTPAQLQIMLYNGGTMGYTDAAIVFRS